ncbi:MAG: glycosylase [Clostridiaceae bacterium]|jgi:beta-1,4-mannooligosaccharide/beta-1,4-mannosyl-N-acetylglucosamine phosphorylase|nr:glycosylase [Clostridiaceae bacterium]
MGIIGKPLKNIPWQDKPGNCKGVVWRYTENPIIDRNPTKRCGRVYNSAVIPFGSGFIGVFRADQTDGKARLHLGRSDDAIHWEIEDEPIRWKDEEGKPYDPNYAYDPRLVELDGVFYIIWCTDFGGAALGLGMTRDFREFIRLENPFPPFNRNGVLFPRKINGKYMLLSRPSDSGHTPFGDIFISESSDLRYWGRHRRVMSRGGSGWWQSTKIGAGPVPIETDVGWLLFYHGVTTTCSGYVYSMGAAILDRDNPSIVKYRSADYLLTPEMPYETTGFVPNVVFPCATLHDAETGRIAIYYGAADTYVALAFAQADEVVEFIKSNSELVYGDNVEYR